MPISERPALPQSPSEDEVETGLKRRAYNGVWAQEVRPPAPFTPVEPAP